MAKAPKQPVDLDGLVKEALLKVALAETPLKLTGKGDGFLFATASGPTKEVIARLKDTSRPLILENGAGKAATLELSAAGFERIADALPADRIGSIVGGMSLRYDSAARASFLQDLLQKSPAVAPGLVSLMEEAVQAEKVEAEARATEAEKRRAADAATSAALERLKSLLQERKKQRIETLKHELAAEGADVDVIGAPPVPKPPIGKHPDLPHPADGEDVGFRRNVARRLVSSWVEAWDSNKPDAREFLESALWNVTGFRPLGEAEQRISFDGRYHEGEAGVFTNDPVQVVRPGWVLDEGDGGEYVVLKARVKK